MLLRLDQQKPPIGERFRSHDRLCQSFPLRRLDHAARPSYREGSLNFEPDSQTKLPQAIAFFIPGAGRDFWLDPGDRRRHRPPLIGDKTSFYMPNIDVGDADSFVNFVSSQNLFVAPAITYLPIEQFTPNVNAISAQQERTEPSGHRPCRRGVNLTCQEICYVLYLAV
jgi:hypothetical protein